MISKIMAQNIKGLTFVQDIDEHTLFIGPNGAGKSAHSQALVLALIGYIPGGGKTNADILESYGSADKLIVGVHIGDSAFERGFVRKEKTVSQGYKVNGKGVKEGDFYSALGIKGAPKAIDISAFMALSDAKKIDAIMELYPPAEDVAAIVRLIEEAKQKINTLAARGKEKEGAAAQLTAARASMQLPPGTLAEVYFQIKEKEAELERYRKELKEVEIEEAKQRAAEEERVRLEKQEAQRKAKEEEDKRRELLRRQAEQIKTEESTAAQIRQASVYEKPAEKVLGFVPTPAEHDPLSSIKVILDALNDAGCSACAARLVAIREMKKYARKEAA